MPFDRALLGIVGNSKELEAVATELTHAWGGL
jgi:hypothetical protein